MKKQPEVVSRRPFNIAKKETSPEKKEREGRATAKLANLRGQIIW